MNHNDDMDIFKQLDGYASPINTDQLWAGIEPNLPQHKAPRRPFGIPIWWLGGALGLAIVAGLYFGMQNQPTATSEVVAPVALLTIPEGTDAKSSTQIELEKAITQHAQAGTATISSANSLAAMPNALAGKAREGVTTNHGLVQARSTSSRKASNSRNNQTVNTGYTEIAAVAETTSVALPQNSQTTTDFYAKTVENQLLKYSILRPLPQVKTNLRTYQIAPSIGKQPDPQTGCYDWGGSRRLRPYMGVYVGPHLTMRTMSARAREFEAWAAQRDATEIKLEAISAGAFIGVQAKNGLSVDAGFDFLRINEKLKAVSSITDTIGQFITIGIIVNAPGDTTFIQDSVYVTQTTTTTNTIYNKYNFYSIPVAIGYTFPTKGRLMPYVKAGAQFSLSTSQKVGMLDGTGQVQVFKSSDANASGYPFRAKMGITPFVQAGARFMISGGLEAFGEVRYLHHTRDVTNDNFGVAQRYKLIGAQIGLRIGL
jgi:hypothetical protein